MDLQDLIEKIDALETRAGKALDVAQKDPSKLDEVKSLLHTEIQPEINRLKSERMEREQRDAIKSISDEIGSLRTAMNDLRKPESSLWTPDPAGKAVDLGDNPYATGEHSYFADIKLANKGHAKALERLSYALPEGDIKAMTEGTDAQGGYLVLPQIERQIVEAVEQDNILRALATKVNVTTDELQFFDTSLSTAAGWVAELAEKPETTSLAQTTVSVNIFTAAGLATISNQLLADARPSIDSLVTADLTKRLTALEEAAFLNGSGTGQPRGILNTVGVQTLTVTDTDPTATDGLLDKLLDADAAIETETGDSATGWIMHPRTWTRIIKEKDANGVYWIDGSRAQAGRPSNKTLFGKPVHLSNRVPTNLGAGTNQSVVIAGRFSEALVLDRQGVTVDESPHVHFTSNQTVFRAEKRVGFTAARSPKSFVVIGGAGLVNG